MLVGVNEKGLRVGQDHHRAKLLDADVWQLLTLHSMGTTIAQCARIFEISKSHAWRIVHYEHRAQTPVEWRKV